MSRIKAILFDKDGTLLDFHSTWIPINREIAFEAAGGDTATAHALLRAGGQDPESHQLAYGALLAGAGVEAIVDCFAGELKDKTPRDLPAIVARHFREGGAKYATLIDGVGEVLAMLKSRNYRMGIATNDTLDGLAASLGKHDGLLDYFDHRYCCDSGYGAKPEPGMGLAFAEHTGVPPSACAMIGDTLHDLEMGHRAGYGLKIGVLTGPARKEDLAIHADVVLPSVRDIETAL